MQIVGYLCDFFSKDFEQPNHRCQIGLILEPRIEKGLGRPNPLLCLGLIQVNALLKLIRHHLLQVFDEIRDIDGRVPLVTLLFCSPCPIL